MSSENVKSSERSIYNKGYEKHDIMPDQDIMAQLYAKRNKWLEERLLNFKSNTDCLDVGCGEGHTSIKLANFGFKVTGVDISDNRIFKAKKKADDLKLNANFIVGDVEDVGFIDGSFDLVYCTSILHHLPDVEADLEKFSKVLKQGGAIVVTEPGLLNPFAFIRRKFFPTSVHTPDEHPFIPVLFLKMFKKHFSRVEYKYFYILSIIAPIIGKIFGKKAGNISLRLFEPIDFILTKIPIIRELSWIINVQAYK